MLAIFWNCISPSSSLFLLLIYLFKLISKQMSDKHLFEMVSQRTKVQGNEVYI